MPYHPDLHSFPTRRSSDLLKKTPVGQFIRTKQEVVNIENITEGGKPKVRVAFKQAGSTSDASETITADYCISTIPLPIRSEEHTSELQSQSNLVCRLLLEK